jgi:glycosyltransferase involved in cell wall biosynthesis
MTTTTKIKRVALAADYLPRQCGIATFTNDLRTALAMAYPQTDFVVAAVNDNDEGYSYPDEVRFEWSEPDLDSYRRAADFINFSNSDAVSLQHEFGIYGGQAGSHVLSLVRDLRRPVVTTLHTILTDPAPAQHRVMTELAEESARLVVMSEKGREILGDVYNVPEDKIDLIPHGIHDMPFVDPNFYKDHFGVEGRPMALTFGLLSRNKGIENVLQAMPAVIDEFPDFVYIVVGATHPAVVRQEGESYRRSLERTARDLDLERNVIFYNRFVELEELKEFIGASDIYITPYLTENQITSGTLAYCFGAGKAVISTPYWHAAELLADERGILVPFEDPAATSDAILALLRDETKRHGMRKQAYLMSRSMVWNEVAQRYMESFEAAKRTRVHAVSHPLEPWTLEERPLELPKIRLDYLKRLTDATGLLQHASYSVARFDEGYATDDNSRALLLTVLLDEAGYGDDDVRHMASTYAAFLQYAFDERGFRAVLGYDRAWRTARSDDAIGRVLRAVGACVGRSTWTNLQAWAVALFDRSLPSVLDTSSPRAWASAIIGLNDYLTRLGGARQVDRVLADLTGRLVKLFHENASDEWHWFEDVVTYDNAVLPHALIVAGHRSGDTDVLETGLRSLRWLASVQTADEGRFRPIGTEGFYARGSEPARFDQQPLEAQAMTSACLAAYRITGDNAWFDEAQRAFEWFLGGNDLGAEVYDANSGGCHDGLHEDRINLNQGAESTLAFLQALVEMQQLERTHAIEKSSSPTI